mmetsp:Transcript_7684/g.11409  ORF Transcript_7684/g.11409 Transcript_7684/m.11409 type:complete len:108 (-) Transcript_7684:18-341(-)
MMNQNDLMARVLNLRKALLPANKDPKQIYSNYFDEIGHIHHMEVHQMFVDIWFTKVSALKELLAYNGADIRGQPITVLVGNILERNTKDNRPTKKKKLNNKDDVSST